MKLRVAPGGILALVNMNMEARATKLACSFPGGEVSELAPLQAHELSIPFFAFSHPFHDRCHTWKKQFQSVLCAVARVGMAQLSLQGVRAGEGGGETFYPTGSLSDACNSQAWAG